MHDPVEARPHELVGRVAGYLAQPAVGEQPAPLRVEQPGADRCLLVDLLEASPGVLGERVGATAGGDVDDHGHGARVPALRCLFGAVDPQRPDVDHQAVPLIARPDLARSRLSLQRRFEERLDGAPDLLGKGAVEEAALAADAGVAEACEHLPGGQDEAQLIVEDDDQRLGKLAQGRRRGFFGARKQGVRPEVVMNRPRHTLSIGRSRLGLYKVRA